MADETLVPEFLRAIRGDQAMRSDISAMNANIDRAAAEQATMRFKAQKRRALACQFCTEVARSERFELPTLRFEV